MSSKIIPENILFLDIETVPQYNKLQNSPELYQQLWDKKAKQIAKFDQIEENSYLRAGIYAEFGKIICISTGYIKNIDKNPHLFIKSYYHKDERTLLNAFCKDLNQFISKKERYLCAHNGKEFDFPYLARRMVILGIDLPQVLKIHGAKPWETPFLDTMELWKFGDRKNYTSLELLAFALNIPTPKDDINGGQVAEIYYEMNDLSRIVSYCRKDVLTIVQIWLRFQNLPLIANENIKLI